MRARVVGYGGSFGVREEGKRLWAYTPTRSRRGLAARLVEDACASSSCRSAESCSTAASHPCLPKHFRAPARKHPPRLLLQDSTCSPPSRVRQRFDLQHAVAFPFENASSHHASIRVAFPRPLEAAGPRPARAACDNVRRKFCLSRGRRSFFWTERVRPCRSRPLNVRGLATAISRYSTLRLAHPEHVER